MADELDGLLGRVEDPALRADLRVLIDRIRAKRTFGLVFESHLPERVRLPEHPVRAASKVALRDKPAGATYQVVRVRGDKASIRKIRHPDGTQLPAPDEADAANEDRAVDTLVVIADFGEPIYPGLRRLSSVDRGGDKPAHVVIKGENHHVLEALQFTHAGKVDCIYIDPPYNTGARDWKYDNNYVDDTDAYRHSKWLAFMERRLLLARELLNPERSVLICAIDEKEYLRLGLLLEQTFPEALIQMVSTLSIRQEAPGRDHLAGAMSTCISQCWALRCHNGYTFRESGFPVVAERTPETCAGICFAVPATTTRHAGTGQRSSIPSTSTQADPGSPKSANPFRQTSIRHPTVRAWSRFCPSERTGVRGIGRRNHRRSAHG